MKNNLLKTLKNIPKLGKRTKISKIVKSNIKSFGSLTLSNKLRLINYYLLSLISIIGTTLHTIFAKILGNKLYQILLLPFMLAIQSLFLYRWFRIITFSCIILQFIYSKYDINFLGEMLLFIISAIEYSNLMELAKEYYYRVIDHKNKKPEEPLMANINTESHPFPNSVKKSLSELEKTNFLNFSLISQENNYIERPWYHKKRYMIPLTLFIFGDIWYFWGTPSFLNSQYISWAYKPFTWMFSFIPNFYNPFTSIRNSINNLFSWDSWTEWFRRNRGGGGPDRPFTPVNPAPATPIELTDLRSKPSLTVNTQISNIQSPSSSTIGPQINSATSVISGQGIPTPHSTSMRRFQPIWETSLWKDYMSRVSNVWDNKTPKASTSQLPVIGGPDSWSTESTPQ